MVLLGFWRSFTTGSHPSYRSCRKWWLAGHTQRSHGFWNGCLSLKNIWYHGFRWYFWWFLMCFWSISTSMLFTNATMLIIHYITLHYISISIISSIPTDLRFAWSRFADADGTEDAFRRKTNTKFSLWRFKCAFSDPQPQPAVGAWWSMAFRERSGAERSWARLFLWWAQEFFNNHGEIVEICWEPGNLMWMYFCDSICLWKPIFGW